MNIAPFLLAKMRGWALPDDPICKQANELIKEVPHYSEASKRYVSFLHSHDLEEIGPRTARPAGLLHVRAKAWESMLPTVHVRRDERTLTSRGPFLHAIHLVEPTIVLLFPDDSGREPNLCFFLPTVDRESNLILHRLRLPADPEARKEDLFAVNDDGHCAAAIRGKLPGRRLITCARTGCHRDCTPLGVISRNRFTTIRCECP